MSTSVGEAIDMSSFTSIGEFDDVSKFCQKDSQCKVAKVTLLPCSEYVYMAYSSLKIYDLNEDRLLRQAGDSIERDKIQLKAQEACFLRASPTAKGICRHERCGIFYIWE